jgi:hypothetical protein
MRCSPSRGIYGTGISVNISIMKSGCIIEVALLAVREGMCEAQEGKVTGQKTKDCAQLSVAANEVL